MPYEVIIDKENLNLLMMMYWLKIVENYLMLGLNSPLEERRRIFIRMISFNTYGYEEYVWNYSEIQ